MPPTESRTVRFNTIFTYPTIADSGQNLRRQVADRYQIGEQPDQSTLLMDGTHFLTQRSLSMACATNLPSPLPSPSNTEANDMETLALTDSLLFQKCRKCAGEYVVQLRSGGNVTIIVGVPQAEMAPYKTMSYVWGRPPDAEPLSVPCVQCAHVTFVPMINARRFHNLVELGGSGNTVWIDVISIDQSDKEDVTSTIAVMGEIYKNAACVSVLLPDSDQAAYECLKEIEQHAEIILLHRNNFIENSDFTIEDLSTGERIKVLTMICQHFLENLKRLGEHIDRFVYWSRAWTFQKWALAKDLEIAVEGGSKAETCFNLKSLVLGAAILISRYSILQNGYAEIKLGEGMNRGKIPSMFNSVKSLFPDEDLFLSYEEIDAKEASFQYNFPHFGVTHMLGVRGVPPPLPTPASDMTSISTSYARSDPLARLRARLILLLSAFASSERGAKHEADLVACWATMCNIVYAYDRNDDFVVALKKAVKALRAQGLVVYDFLPDTKGGRGSPVAMFRAYAREHHQLNATNYAEFPGAPIFSGRADTVSHLIYSLDKVNIPTVWNDCDDSNCLRPRIVVGAKVAQSVAMDGNIEAAMSAFASNAVYGELLQQGFMFWAVQDVAKLYLERFRLKHSQWHDLSL